MLYLILGSIGLLLSLLALLTLLRPRTQLCPGCQQRRVSVGYVCMDCTEEALR
jgi:predicted amidophosphoribosyltransferase